MHLRWIPVVALVIGLSTATYAQELYRVQVNGRIITTDVPPQNVNGRLLVPLRAVSEALGAEVGYNPETRTAIIEMRPQANHQERLLEMRALNNLMRRSFGVVQFGEVVVDMHWGVSRYLEGVYSRPEFEEAWGQLLEVLQTWRTAIAEMEPHYHLSPAIQSAVDSHAQLTPRQIAREADSILQGLSEIKTMVLAGKNVDYKRAEVHRKALDLQGTGTFYFYRAYERMHALLAQV